MILIFLFSIYFLALKKKLSISGFLCLLVLFSTLSAYLIDEAYQATTNADYFNEIFVSIILLLFIDGFRNYHGLKFISIPVKFNLDLVAYGIMGIGLIAVAVNSYIVYKAIGLIFLDSLNIGLYKNEGGAAQLLSQWVPSYLLRYSHATSPLGYMALALHFYYLNKGKGHTLKSVVFLIISLNIPLHGLHGLSRAATAMYILLYSFSFLFFSASLSKKFRIKVTRVLIIASIPIFTILIIITNSRFTGSYFIESRIKHTSLVQNYALYSVFDYLSQWNRNGLEVLRIYDDSKIMNAKSSTPILEVIPNVYSNKRPKESITDVRKESMAQYGTWFTGVVATLIYDLGYPLTFLFGCFYFLLTRLNGPRDGTMKLHNVMFLMLLLPVPVMFFMNLYLSYLLFHLAIIYTIATAIFLKLKLTTSEPNE